MFALWCSELGSCLPPPPDDDLPLPRCTSPAGGFEPRGRKREFHGVSGAWSGYSLGSMTTGSGCECRTGCWPADFRQARYPVGPTCWWLATLLVCCKCAGRPLSAVVTLNAQFWGTNSRASFDLLSPPGPFDVVLLGFLARWRSAGGRPVPRRSVSIRRLNEHCALRPQLGPSRQPLLQIPAKLPRSPHAHQAVYI